MCIAYDAYKNNVKSAICAFAYDGYKNNVKNAICAFAYDGYKNNVKSALCVLRMMHTRIMCKVHYVYCV